MESTNVKMSMLIRRICSSAFTKLQIQQELKVHTLHQSDFFVYAGSVRPRIRLGIIMLQMWYLCKRLE